LSEGDAKTVCTPVTTLCRDARDWPVRFDQQLLRVQHPHAAQRAAGRATCMLLECLDEAAAGEPGHIHQVSNTDRPMPVSRQELQAARKCRMPATSGGHARDSIPGQGRLASKFRQSGLRILRDK